MLAKYELTIEEELVEQAELIYTNLGIDLASAIQMFLVKSIREQGIPFNLNLNSQYQAFEAAQAVIELSEYAEKTNISNMSLDEINRIIAETRKEAKERRACKEERGVVEK